MKTNEVIFQEINEQGYITKQQINLLKRRSNREGKDVLDYGFINSINNGYGIPCEPLSGEQGLKWLKKFINRKGESNVFGYREIKIVTNAKAEDFTFKGFYDAGNKCFRNYFPIYELNGMEYIPMREPYIIG